MRLRRWLRHPARLPPPCTDCFSRSNRRHSWMLFAQSLPHRVTRCVSARTRWSLLAAGGDPRLSVGYTGWPVDLARQQICSAHSAAPLRIRQQDSRPALFVLTASAHSHVSREPSCAFFMGRRLSCWLSALTRRRLGAVRCQRAARRHTCAAELRAVVCATNGIAFRTAERAGADLRRCKHFRISAVPYCLLLVRNLACPIYGSRAD